MKKWFFGGIGISLLGAIVSLSILGNQEELLVCSVNNFNCQITNSIIVVGNYMWILGIVMIFIGYRVTMEHLHKKKEDRNNG